MKPVTSTTQLFKSSHLVVIPAGQEYVVYHSLFGHPTMVNQQGLEVLNLFSAPQTPADIRKQYSIPGLSKWLRIFTKNRLLVRHSIHERTLLKRIVQRGIHRIAKGANLTSLGLILEEACNFDCQHCVSLKLLRVSHRSTPNTKRMTMATAKDAIDKFIAFVRRHNHRTLEIYFGGSEPLLNWEVFKGSIEYCQTTYGKEFKFTFSTNTNSSLIDRDRAKYLAKHRVIVTSSLDGLQPVNDVSRQYSSGKGTFQQIIAGWDELGKVRKAVKWFSLTLTDRNIDGIDEPFFEFLESREIPSCTIEPDLIEALKHSSEEVVRTLFQFKEWGKKHGVTVGGMWDKPFNNFFPTDPRPNLFNCSAFTGRGISVLPSGDIVICSYSGIKLGTINDLEAMFASDQLQSFISSRAAGNIPACRGCELEGQCMGGCYLTPEYGDYTGSQAAFNYRCEIFKLATRTLLKSMVEA